VRRAIWRSGWGGTHRGTTFTSCPGGPARGRKGARARRHPGCGGGRPGAQEEGVQGRHVCEGGSPWADAYDEGEGGEGVAEAFCVAPGDSEDEEEGEGGRGERRGGGARPPSGARGSRCTRPPWYTRGTAPPLPRIRTGTGSRGRGDARLRHLPAQAATGGTGRAAAGRNWRRGQTEGEGGSAVGASRRPVRRMSVGEEREHELREGQRDTSGPHDDREREWGREGGQGVHRGAAEGGRSWQGGAPELSAASRAPRRRGAGGAWRNSLRRSAGAPPPRLPGLGMPHPRSLPEPQLGNPPPTPPPVGSMGSVGGMESMGGLGEVGRAGV